MSQFISEDSAGRVSAFSATTSPRWNNRSDACTAATPQRASFLRHLLVFFLKITQILFIFACALKIDSYICVSQSGHAFSYAAAGAF